MFTYMLVVSSWVWPCLPSGHPCWKIHHGWFVPAHQRTALAALCRNKSDIPMGSTAWLMASPSCITARWLAAIPLEKCCRTWSVKFPFRKMQSIAEANWAVDTASEDICRTPGSISWLQSNPGVGKFGQERCYSEWFDRFQTCLKAQQICIIFRD